MSKITKEAGKKIRPLTEIAERELLERLAAKVPAGGTIVEIGCLYGGTTAVLALAAPGARVITIDSFSWWPPDGAPSSKAQVKANLAELNITNVEVIHANSRLVGAGWPDDHQINLLWVDGGHTYDDARQDLENFGRIAQTIAVHDYILTGLPEVKQAVDDFIRDHHEWSITDAAHSIVVLRRRRSNQ